jgi:hypothetical protein
LCYGSKRDATIRGALLIVRVYGGRPLIRRSWDVGESVVFVTREQMFQLLMQQDDKAIGPIGFSKEDVFQYDPTLIESIMKFLNAKQFNWRKLAHFGND